MSLIADILAEQMLQSIDGTDVTREDYERALDQVFGHEQDALNPTEVQPHTVEYEVSWTIDQGGKTPAEAAAAIWKQVFRRGPVQPGEDESCVFDVSDGTRSVRIDLSEERYSDLFSHPGEPPASSRGR